jgi:hypothetical protein
MSARCDGTRAGFSLRCNASLYRCVCGATGCTQNKPELCSNQNFEVNQKCVKCGAIGKRELVAPEQVGFFSTLMHDPN